MTIYLEDGNRPRAMKRLHIPPIGEHQSIWTTFNLGLLMGIFFSLFAICILIGTRFVREIHIIPTIELYANRFFDCSVIHRVESKDVRIMSRLYRGTFFIILFIYLCGLNVYGWRTSGVNHILIFEINPRSHLTVQHILQIASIFGILWTLSVLAFVFRPYATIPAYSNPVVLIFALIFFLLNPTKTIFFEARWWFLKVIVSTCVSDQIEFCFALHN